MQITAYVQTIDGLPLMPVKRPGRVRRMLKTGKARIISRCPLTIRLTYPLEEERTQPVILGVDPGRTNIGLCAINDGCEPIYASDVETRNKMVPKLMQERKQHRMASRQGERQVRKRQAKKNGTLFDENREDIVNEDGALVWNRNLPMCEKTVPVKDIRNTEARFCHRKRKRGWLTPTANQLLQTHMSSIWKVMDILPVTDIVLEVNRFAFARMEDPDITPAGFKNGPLHGFMDLQEAILAQQNGHCIFCRKPIDDDHHILPRSCGGSDTLANMAGLCKHHHRLVHVDPEWAQKLIAKKAGLEKKYGALSVLNQIIPYLIDYLGQMEPWLSIHYTNGWDTKELRESLGLEKDHYIDAWCIAASIFDDATAPEFHNLYHLMQFRRHNRAIIQRTESRKYLLDGKVVAVNRKKAVTAIPKEEKDGTTTYVYKGQTEKSLEEFRQEMEKIHGKKEADRIISTLQVKKSERRKNTMDREMPGALCKTKDGKRFLMQGQHNNCTRYIESIAGLTACKAELAQAKKELRTAKKQQSEDVTMREKKVEQLQMALPKAKEHQESCCKVLLHNAGLMYVPV